LQKIDTLPVLKGNNSYQNVKKLIIKRSYDELRDTLSEEEGASSSPILTPAAIVNEGYVSLLSWDENQLFPK
jgi:hypothetical protein